MINYQGGDTFSFDKVINNSLSLLQKFGQQQAEQQKLEKEARQKEQVNAMKELSKIDSNGIRQQDLDSFYKQFYKLKDVYYQMGKSTSDKERFELNFKLNQDIENINRLVARSKEIKGWEVNGLKYQADSKYDRNRLTSSLERIRNLKAENSWDFEYNDYADALRTFDNDKVLRTLKDADERLLKSKNINVNVSKTADGKRELQVVSVGEDEAIKTYTDLYKTDENFKNYVQSQGDNPALVIANLVDSRASQGFYEVADISKPNKGITINNYNGKNDVTSPQNSLVEWYPIAVDANTGKEVRLRRYQQFNQSQKIGGVINGIDPTNGSKIRLDGNSTSVNVLGLGSDTKGNEYALISYEEGFGNLKREKTALINKNTYLNNSQLSKSEKPYVNESSKVAKKDRQKSVPSQTKNKNEEYKAQTKAVSR